MEAKPGTFEQNELLAKAMERVIDLLPDEERTVERATRIRNAIRADIRDGEVDLKNLISSGLSA